MQNSAKHYKKLSFKGQHQCTHSLAKYIITIFVTNLVSLILYNEKRNLLSFLYSENKRGLSDKKIDLDLSLLYSDNM